MSRKVSRRGFIRTASLGLAGGYLALNPAGALAQRMGGGGGGMGGGSSVIDPPVGALLKEPPLAARRAIPGGFEVDLTAMEAKINVNGTTARLMTYNGLFPGPTIKVNQGDLLKINFTNGLPSTTAVNLLGYRKNITNLHTHGWHVSPLPPSDYVMYDLMPGQNYHHEYDTAMQEAGTLCFYHTHKHGVAAEQYWAGMVGALVTADPDPLETGGADLSAYETKLLILKDLTITNGAPAPHSMMSDYMHGKEGNTVMVNGQVNPRLYIKAGQVQRWRILNASNARFYRLSVENHAMHLIGTDGGLLDRPYQVAELLLSPGERVDVLVKGVQSTGNHRLRALPYSRMGMMGSSTITLMTLTYNGQLTPAQVLPAVINPSAQRLSMDTAMLPQRTLRLSMGQGNGYINGQDFDVKPYEIHSAVETHEVWEIINDSGMDHPFHQHVNAAQVLSVTGGDPGYASLYTTTPSWKDTVLVPKWGSVKILVPVMDFTGMAMFHCHILEHEDIGMMGMWHIMDMPM